MKNNYNKLYNKKSVSDFNWKIESTEERDILLSSQKNNISPLLAKLLLLRNIDNSVVQEYLYPDFKKNIPNPFLLKDMYKAVTRVHLALEKNEKIGIIADYDVDGSTSATILYKFLNNFNNKITINIPNRLSEGYGPNTRIMNELVNENVNLIFCLDCGTSSSHIFQKKEYKNIDIIIIDHHVSESILPKVHSLINPNRFDENNDFKNLAAVGVTFLFLMGLRKELREKNFFDYKKKEPNLSNFLDLVALGTVCDVVNLDLYNRSIVTKGLEIIQQRRNLGITKIIDKSNLNSIPNSGDLGFIIGPQLNAASRIDDSSLPYKLLISKNIDEVEAISKKLILLNEKRKLIENNVFDDAFKQAESQKNQNFIMVHGKDWHNGILGIVASRLTNIFYKPTIVISFTNLIGVGSARSINNIDLSNIIIQAKNNNILIVGGGHKMAAGLKINYNNINKFEIFLKNYFDNFAKNLFQRIEKFDAEISSNEINNDLLEMLEIMEPFGSGNPEPKFIIKDIKIASSKVIKNKHILVFFQNDFSDNLKAICFNCVGTNLGDYLLNYSKQNLALGCSIRKNNFNNLIEPQIIIKDAMIVN